MPAITRLCSTIAVLLLLTYAAAIAQQGSTQHAKVELIARQVAVSSGKDLLLGIHFMLEKGWHIYWINPGDSGQPPSFKWQLPSDFSAGEIQWPRPERLQPSKELVDYGYDGEVLLPFTIHVPSVISDRSAEFGADAKWLICREVCIPEHASLHLTLPVSSAAGVEQKNAELFAKTDKLIPQLLPRAWNVSLTSTKDDLVLTIRAGKAITKVEFFPLDPGQIDNPAPQKLQPTSNGAKITLKKSDLLVKPISVLRGVLVIPGGPSYRIEAPVRQPIQ
ncbi:MAG TPA: protein-disulfide reductase DsbD domain-containing protein [Candidatus Angelobacter sp.]|nr:protein-disulfide reductase DsbD domain-containing protein [Candidatus Angelobacter sp.]